MTKWWPTSGFLEEGNWIRCSLRSPPSEKMSWFKVNQMLKIVVVLPTSRRKLVLMNSVVHHLNHMLRTNIMTNEKGRDKFPCESRFHFYSDTRFQQSYSRVIFSNGTVKHAFLQGWAINSQSEGDDSPCLTLFHLFHKNILIDLGKAIYCFINMKN